ncbi:MAG: bifunctional UDP-N-acetylglucosamine diphosphorylase/glucosamine-1-phosphate N-acetyltransferase GlmU, partial [Burkholderiales bacterium]|nr:bifunctional UDP-N-acetylglucosamine diphosphorylase/glucosamine-1-phosphate N-acetyltransferase GlmU [Burkholderiales bacterium]
MTALDVVIMAAGKGMRMKSSMPKVLHLLAGKPLVQHVIDTAQALHARNTILITGHGAEVVEPQLLKAYPNHALQFAKQMPQLGTGHAVQQALPLLDDDAVVVVLSGDVPLTQADTLQALIQACDEKNLALLTIDFEDPTGYGRIVRGFDHQVHDIIEHKDADELQREIKEVYSGIMAVPAKWLKKWLPQLKNDNAQKEFYLTDVVKMAVADHVHVVGHKITDAAQVAGINSPLQLAELERIHQTRQAHTLLARGVRISDPARFDLRGSLTCQEDVSIDINCIFEGQVQLGAGVRIGAHCVISNCVIEDGATILPFTHIDGETQGVTIGKEARIGPFARLRPGAQLGADVHVGNFVEIKNSTLADGAKANHLAYLGDATVGERVNYGAGSITANYDGANKHRTTIEADAHIGSNCVLVAP